MACNRGIEAQWSSRSGLTRGKAMYNVSAKASVPIIIIFIIIIIIINIIIIHVQQFEIEEYTLIITVGTEKGPGPIVVPSLCRRVMGTNCLL